MIGGQEIPKPAKGLPQSVLDCYYKRMNGSNRDVTAFRDGAIFTARIREGGVEELAERDVEAMKALVSDGAVASWEKMEKLIGGQLLPVLFEALWQANMDWGSLRKDNGATRMVDAKEISNEIARTAQEIEQLLDALEDVVRPVASIGYRHPDQWPDSPSIRNELAHLQERCARFHAKVGLSSFDEVNAALSGRKTGGEYARALVCLLDDAGALKTETHHFVTSLVALAGLVDPNIDESSIRNAVKKKYKR